MHTIAPTTVTCPYCDAKPGAPCRTATGNIARTHADRVRVASAPDEVTIEETVEEVTDSDVDTLMSITHHKVSASDWSDQTTEGAMRRQEARDQANDLARTLTGPARRLLWATADGIDHLQAVLHDHGITPTTIEETTSEDTIDVSDIDRINRVFEESRAISPEINELLGVWDDGPIRILTDQEQTRLDELLDKNRTLVDEMRILTKRITAARRTGNRANRPHAAPATAPAENHNTPHPAARRITATGTVASRRCGDGITRTVIELDTRDRVLFETGIAPVESTGLRAGERWEEGRSVISVDDEGFVLLSIDSRPTHPGRARRIAYKILAAAAQAQKDTQP